MGSFKDFLGDTPADSDTIDWPGDTVMYSRDDDIAAYHRLTPQQQRKYLSKLPLPQLISILWRSHQIKRPIK